MFDNPLHLILSLNPGPIAERVRQMLYLKSARILGLGLFSFTYAAHKGRPFSKDDGRPAVHRANDQKESMSTVMIATLLSLWLIGVVTSYTLGGFLHLLFLLALIVFAISVIRDRRVAA